MARQPLLNVRLSRERAPQFCNGFSPSDRDTASQLYSESAAKSFAIDRLGKRAARSVKYDSPDRPILAALSKQKSRFSFIMQSQTVSEHLR